MTIHPDLPLPVPTALSRPFWAAANEGRLELQRCNACGTYFWTPQILCKACLSDRLTWMPVSGRGRIYSFTVVHRAPLAAFGTPYVLATVELDEGPLMLTQIVGGDPAAVTMEAPVEVAFTRASEDINLYTFRLA